MHKRINKSKQIDKIVSILSSLCCYGGCIYMMVILFCQYNDNRDSSQASMKRFNESPSGRYPSFTFCIYAKAGKLFKEEILLKKFGLSKEAYYQIIAGERNATNLDFSKIKFDEIVTRIEEFLEVLEAEDNSYITYNEWSPSMKNTMGSPLRQGYHDPTTNCFTYDTPYNRSISLNTLKIKFNITKFQHLFENSGKIYIQAHHPGLLIRNMKMFLMKVSHWENLKPENGNNQILIQLPGITVMRFRETADEACDPNLIDDDTKWKQEVVQKIGCIPPYWNNNTENHLPTNNISQNYHTDAMICNSQEKLNLLKSYWPVDGGILANPLFNSYMKPCIKMTIFNTIYKDMEDDPEFLKIKIRIQEELYQEVLNTRGFGMADLWASIGGYVGVFCGFSIHQAAISLISYLKRSLRVMDKSQSKTII